MKIISITKLECFSIQTDEKYPNEYTRYNANNWTVRMGESDEPVYDFEELENLYKESENKRRKYYA